MADSSPLADLLDRAGEVFTLAGNLGRAFQEEKRAQENPVNIDGWGRHSSVFDQFCHSVLELRGEMQDPPKGFEVVSEQLLQAARVARDIRDVILKTDGLLIADYLEFFPELNSVFQYGWEAVKEASKAQQPEDPFAFVDQPEEPSLLETHPEMALGHIGCAEFARDEVHNAAEAKRQHKYSNDTLAGMVRGARNTCAEAKMAMKALRELWGDSVEPVAVALQRKLTVGTVEQIDTLLTQAVQSMRDDWEKFRSGHSTFIDDELVENEHPEETETKEWLVINGVKGSWCHYIRMAEFWSVEVDARHRNIAFLLKHVIGEKSSEDAIRRSCNIHSVKTQ